MGGSGFTLFPEEIMNALDADYGIIGEGERLALLLDALENQERCRHDSRRDYLPSPQNKFLCPGTENFIEIFVPIIPVLSFI